MSFDQLVASIKANDNNKIISIVNQLNESASGLFGPELKALITVENKKLVLAFGTNSLLDKKGPLSEIPTWLNLLKILARTQADLDSLYASEFILYLSANIQTYHSSTEPTEIAILSQSLRLLLNLCITSKNQVHKAFDNASLIALIGALPNTTNSNQEPDAIFFFIRILMFILVSVPLARVAIEQGNVYEILVSLFLKYSDNKMLGIQLRDNNVANTTNAASSSSSTSSSVTYESTTASNFKLSLEILKVLTNTSVLDSKLPTCAAVLHSEKSSLYDAYLQRIAAILAYGVEIPEECLEGYKGDPIANASIGTLMPTVTSPSVDSSSIAAEEPSTNSVNSTSSTAAVSSADPVSTTIVALEDVHLTPVQRQQTRIILANMAKEAEADSDVTILNLQQDSSNLLLGLDGIVPYLESDGCRAFHGLIQLLHRALILAGKDKKQGEVLLSPILSVLNHMVPLSPKLRAHAKRAIFLDLAEPPAQVNGQPYKKADASNYAMTPAGAVSEKITDPDPLSLKSLILQWIITLNFNLKQNVSELLYRICNEDTSEYIRLLGFGNAVGLLAEKGLPGFSMLKQNAIDPNALLAGGKKL